MTQPRKRLAALLLTVFTICVGLAAGASPASAAVILGAGPDIPALGGTLTVGQTNVPSSLTITNTSTQNQSDDDIAISLITLIPSCGTTAGTVDAAGTADCPVPDPEVFRLSPTGTGAAGTACAGTTFQIDLIDMVQGKYRFTPGAPVVLGDANTGGPQSRCVILFTVDVLSVPSPDSMPGLAPNPPDGAQTSEFASARGLAQDGTTGGGFGSNFTSVVRAANLPIATVASTNDDFTEFRDTATLGPFPGNAVPPTGTVTFEAYGPFPVDTPDDVCTGTPLTSAPVPVPAPQQGATTVDVVSPAFDPTATGPGDYHFIARYSGDANYAPFASACGDPNETVTIPAPEILVVKTAALPGDPAPPDNGPAPVRPVPGGDFRRSCSCRGSCERRTEPRSPVAAGIRPSQWAFGTRARTARFVASLRSAVKGAAARLAALGPAGPPWTARLRFAGWLSGLRERATSQPA